MLWGVGNPEILNRPLLGILSARQIDPDLALESSLLLKQLASLDDFSFVGGWHSPLERQALRIVLRHEAPLVFCVAKALNRFVPSTEVEHRLKQGRALLLTHCTPKAKRISRGTSMRRNELILGLAKVLVVLSAPEGSASLKLARSALNLQKPVLTPVHPVNKTLLAIRALPATLANIQTALRLATMTDTRKS